MWERLFSTHTNGESCDKAQRAKSREQAAARCKGNALCIHWALIIGAKDLRTASFAWEDIKKMESGARLPKLALQSGSLVTSLLANSSQTLPLPMELIDVRTTAVQTDLVTRELKAKAAWMLQVEKAVLLYNGVVYTGMSSCGHGTPSPQLAVLDLGGGCCRPTD